VRMGVVTQYPGRSDLDPRSRTAFLVLSDGTINKTVEQRKSRLAAINDVMFFCVECFSAVCRLDYMHRNCWRNLHAHRCINDLCATMLTYFWENETYEGKMAKMFSYKARVLKNLQRCVKRSACNI